MFIIIAAAMLSGLIFFRKSSLIKTYKSGLIIVVLSAIFVPAIVGGIKAVSNTPCPGHLECYGGDYPDVNVFGSYPETFKQTYNVKCLSAITF